MNAGPLNSRSNAKAPDYRLILASLEKRILAGEAPEKTRRIIANAGIWRALPMDLQLQWAALAQMNGDIETALAVLASLNQADPDNLQAWKDRLALLLVLGRQAEAASVMAVARQHVGDAITESLPAPARQLPELAGSMATDPESNAFDRLRRRERQIARYMSLFAGRRSAFARQWADRQNATQGYVPVRRPLTANDIEEHLKGRVTYGIYLMREDGTVSVGVIDADLAAEYRQGKLKTDQRRLVFREKAFMISRIQEISAQGGFVPLIEFSGGKGFHFWFFFKTPVIASRARSLLDTIAGQVSPDLTAFTLEVFPKQDRLSGKGFGNLVKLPLGIHRVTGKPSSFVACKDRSVDAQLAWLAGVEPLDIEKLEDSEKKAVATKVVAHPRWQQWTEQFPELAKLTTHCPPLGQLIALCREGKRPGTREEQILFQTVGFLPRAKTLLHHLYGFSSDYNPHWVDFKLSRLRGTPLGCRRIHALLGYVGDMCVFDGTAEYPHPLLHIDASGQGYQSGRSEKAANLTEALDTLRSAMDRVLVFMK